MTPEQREAAYRLASDKHGHTNWWCTVKWERRLARLLVRMHSAYCGCQVEPWNYEPGRERSR